MIRKVLLALALLFTVLSIGVYTSYRDDQSELADIVARVTADAQTPEDRALALLHWVYDNKGFAKNHGYFLWKKLGPTPIQVLEEGGDCADKSRLLSAMLREIDIPSTAAMCFNHQGQPTHTVVDAEVRPGKYMLLDPIWDLYFPKEEPGEYYSLIDLRRDPQILWRRLDVVTASAAPGSKILKYNREHDIYDHATTLNWDKNGMMRSLRDYLASSRGDAVYALPRPLFIEEPKLFFAVGLAFSALGTIVLYGFASVVARRRDRARAKEAHAALRQRAAA